MNDSQGSFIDGLTTAARENPLAAALIGGGTLWLLIGGDKLKNAAGSVTSAAAPLADLGARAQRSAAPGPPIRSWNGECEASLSSSAGNRPPFRAWRHR